MADAEYELRRFKEAIANRPDWEKLWEEQTERAEALQDKLRRIRDWCDAYPLEVFPEPNWRRAAMVLQDHGISLDSISASNMRHVLDGVRKIIDGETET